MSAPAGGGHTTTLTPGLGGVLLTEYAPGGDASLLVINTSQQRAWLAADSSVSSSNGVPLDPGTAIPWSVPGQLWAIADPAATAPVVLVVTTAISDWTPSPAAIAAEVAAELLATGIPNVLTEQVLAAAVPINPFGGVAEFDVSGFASVTISAGLADASTPNLLLQQVNAGGDVAASEFLMSTAPARIAISGTTLRVVNNGNQGAPTFIYAVGSNRAVAERFDLRQNTAVGDRWTIGTTAMVVNQTVLLTPNFLLPNTPTRLQGAAWASFAISGSTVKGRYEILIEAGSIAVVLADTAEMIVSSSGSQLLTKQIALPASDYTIQFHCTVAGSAAVQCTLIPN